MSKRVLLLLANGFEPLEAAGFTDVLGWANIDGDEPIELVSAALRTPIEATFGFSVMPNALVEDLNIADFDAIAIPGGFAKAGFYQDALSELFGDIIRGFDQERKPIASVCVASLALGAAGVLKGRRATTYHQAGGKRKAQLESYGAEFIDEPIVIDGRLVTSTGPGTAIEVAFELLRLLTSQANADHVRRLMRVPEPTAQWRTSVQVAP